MFRVTKPGGIIVVATLNSLSPWANRRKEAGKKGHPIFRHALLRSPEEIAALSPVEGIIQTAIHFRKPMIRTLLGGLRERAGRGG